MTDTRGTFRLKNVRQNILNEEYVPIPAVWIPGVSSNSGFFLGGGPSPISKSTVDKMSFATDATAYTPSADLSFVRNYVVGNGSKTVGYAMGGFNGGTTFSTIEKITYATDTRSNVPANIGAPRQQFGAAGNDEATWVACGYQGPAGTTPNVKKFVHATETTSPAPNYPFSANGISASGNQDYGYFGAGAPGGSASLMIKLTYSDSTNAQIPSGQLTLTRKLPLSAASSTGAYFAGGNPGPKSAVDKCTFSNDTTARIPGADMVTASGYRGGITSGPAAYWGSPGQTFDKMPFANDTCSALPSGSNLSSDRGSAVGAVSSRDNSNPTALPATRWFDDKGEGDFAVDFDGSGDYLSVASSSDLTFGTGDFTVEFWVKPDNFNGRGTFYDSRPSGGNTGITIGHESSSGEIRVYMTATGGGDIVVQSSDFETGEWQHIAVTRASGTVRLFINGTLKDSETRTSDLNNTNAVNIGYKSFTSSGYTYFDGKISNLRVVKGTAVYTSSFTQPTEILGNITNTKLLCCNSSSTTGSTVTPGVITANGDPTVSNDTTIPINQAPAATPTGTSGSWSYTLAPGVPNHGYYLGGKGNTSTGSTLSMKFSFATDTFDNSVRLTNRFTQGNGTGGKMASSPTHAYAAFGEGNPAPGGDSGSSWVRKVQYSNDTGSNAPNGPSPSYGGGVAGSQTHMYVAGGQDSHGVPLGERTSVRKLTYSNDTWSEISQSNANYSNPSGWPRKNFNSGGTQTHAYWGPGSPNTYRTSISKYTYATDTGIMSIPNVTGSYENVNSIGNSNSTDWYCARGDSPSSPGFQTNISKFVFATDTYTFPTTLHDQWYDYSGSSGVGAINDGMTAGYWSGGHIDQSDSTSTLKITYATETASRGTNIPAGRTPSSNGGGYNAYAGTSCREFGASTSTLPNLI